MDNDKQKLKTKYELSEMGDVKQILGMKITRINDNNILLNQAIYIKDKLQLFGFDNSRIEITPEILIKIINNVKNNITDLTDHEINKYRMMVGSLIYAAISTRPDITHAVNMVSRYMSNPTKLNTLMVKRILRYLAGTSEFGLLYDNNNYNNLNNSNNNEITISAYCDADWGGDLMTENQQQVIVHLLMVI